MKPEHIDPALDTAGIDIRMNEGQPDRDPTLRVIRPRAQVGSPPEPDVHGITELGRVRAHNDDHFLVSDLSRSLWIRSSSVGHAGPRRPVTTRQAHLYVVADGMGGHGGGEIASSVAMDAVADYVFEAMPWFAHLDRAHGDAQTEELRAALLQSQQRVFAVAARKGLSHLRMGTTLTLAYVAWPMLYVLHAGDSRCYLSRADQLWRMTTDHTLAQALEQHPQLRDVAPGNTTHVLTNAVGAGTDELSAEIRRAELVPGDRLLLCTDGLTAHVSDPEIAVALAQPETSAETARSLVDLANARGGSDNVTVVLARF